MNSAKMMMSAPNVVSICVDYFRDSGAEGHLYTKYGTEPRYFENSMELLGMLERFYDWLGYPQASTAGRTFEKAAGRIGQAGPAKPAKKKEKPEEVVDSEALRTYRGRLATFIVHVQYRQNATWQGQITWEEEEKTQEFRSVLELFKLMDSAADTREENEAL